MKRKLYALILVVAMLSMTLVGCGSDATENNTQTDITATDQTTVAQEEEAQEKEHIYISFEFEFPIDVLNYQDYIKNSASVMMRNESGKCIFSADYIRNDGTYIAENKEVVYYELREYDLSDTNIFDCQNEILTQELVLQHFNDNLETAITNWGNDKDERTEVDITDSFPSTLSFEIDGMTFNVDVYHVNCLILGDAEDANNAENIIFDYAEYVDGGHNRVKTGSGVSYQINGYYTCDGDITQNKYYIEEGIEEIGGPEPINTVVLIDNSQTEEPEQEIGEYASMTEYYYEDSPFHLDTKVYAYSSDNSHATIETDVRFNDGVKFIFSWDGDATFGSHLVGSSDGMAGYLWNEDKTARFTVWNAIQIDDSVFNTYRDLDVKEDIRKNVSYADVDTYFEEIKNDDCITAIYAITLIEEGVTYKGYEKLIFDRKSVSEGGLGARFMYEVPAENYNDEQDAKALEAMQTLEIVPSKESLRITLGF